MLAGIELPPSGLILQTTKKKKLKKKLLLVSLPRKQDLTFHAMETICMKCKSYFLGRMKKNISKCRLLKTLPRILSVMVCTNKSCMGLCMAKPITCTKRRISLHILSLHISSLIRAFANRMYRLQSMGLTKRLVRQAKTLVNLRNCTF